MGQQRGRGVPLPHCWVVSVHRAAGEGAVERAEAAGAADICRAASHPAEQEGGGEVSAVPSPGPGSALQRARGRPPWRLCPPGPSLRCHIRAAGQEWPAGCGGTVPPTPAPGSPPELRCSARARGDVLHLPPGSRSSWPCTGSATRANPSLTSSRVCRTTPCTCSPALPEEPPAPPGGAASSAAPACSAAAASKGARLSREPPQRAGGPRFPFSAPDAAGLGLASAERYPPTSLSLGRAHLASAAVEGLP